MKQNYIKVDIYKKFNSLLMKNYTTTILDCNIYYNKH